MGVRAELKKIMMSRRSKLAGEISERYTLNVVRIAMMTRNMFLLRTKLEIRKTLFVLDDDVK